MQFVLDTDHLSILQQESAPACARLLARLDQCPAEEVAVTIVSFQEQMQGWLAYLNQARNPSGILRAYAELKRMLEYYCESTVLAFDRRAQDRFADLRNQHVRIGTLDLRIASIALANSSRLLTRNLRDFRQVPGLSVDDWTK
jgi:tRNA(fMet)-specific endonuclease VapC